MTTIYRGLNVQKLLNDIDDKNKALLNLGLNPEDLQAISGISNDVNGSELKLLAGLVDDQRKEFVSLSYSANEISKQLAQITDFRLPFDFNPKVNNRLIGSAIKFNFLDYALPGSTVNDKIRQADISTSRVSSWSSTKLPNGDPSGKIFYGGEVKVIGNTITLDSLRIVGEPIEKKYAAEVATHKMLMNIDGVQKEVYLMKGIPLVLESFFKDADIYHSVNAVTDGNGTTVQPTWEIQNLDNGVLYVRENAGIGSYSSAPDTGAPWQFRDSSARLRELRFYYNPANITSFQIRNINLSEWFKVTLPAIRKIDLEGNDFFEMPKFGPGSNVSLGGPYDGLTDGDSLAPVLEVLNMTGNNLSRARDAAGNVITANTQLQYLPTTLTTLTVNGAFSDNEVIDLRYLTNLKTLNFDTRYTRDAQRRMTGATDPLGLANGTSPRVDPGIVSYRLYNQPYSRLADGVCDSTTVKTIDITYCNIVRRETAIGANPGDEFITIASNELQYFYSLRGAHNIPDFSGNTNFLRYYHRYARGLPSINGGRTIGTKFSGCTKLTHLHFYATDVEDVTNSGIFQNLGSLLYLDLRWTRMEGNFPNGTFSGTPNLLWLLLAGSRHGIPRTATISGASGDGSVVTYTTSANHGFSIGDSATVTGVTPSSFDTTDKLITNVSANTFQVSSAVTDTYSSGGSVTAKNKDFFGKQISPTGVSEVFHDTKRLAYFYCYNNNNMEGELPDFSLNDNLRLIYIINTGLGGPLPAFNANFRLYYLRAQNSNFSGAVPPFNSTALRYAFLSGNQLSGQIPEITASRLLRLHLQGNQLTGTIPSFSLCGQLQQLYLNGNQISSYTPLAIATNTRLSIIDFSNNNLTANDGDNILADLVANYVSNPRGGVQVNLLNQASLSEANLSSSDNLQFLRNVGWSILLDAT